MFVYPDVSTATLHVSLDAVVHESPSQTHGVPSWSIVWKAVLHVDSSLSSEHCVIPDPYRSTPYLPAHCSSHRASHWGFPTSCVAALHALSLASQ